MTFGEAFKLDDHQFAIYAAESNRAYREKMLAKGWEYWPDFKAWYPPGTEIAGCKPERAALP